MTIAQAFKKKKKLLKEIGKLSTKIKNSNKTLAEKDFTYDIDKLLEEFFSKKKELVTLKTKIIKANLTIYDKIFTLSELKSSITILKSLDGTSGKERVGYSEVIVEYKVVMDELELEAKIEELETKIETIQEELDQYNHTTKI